MGDPMKDVDDVIALLNEALALDRVAVTDLFGKRVWCNRQLADHPTIQVGGVDLSREIMGTGPLSLARPHCVGVLGLLNGLFGVAGDWGVLEMVFGDDDLIERFKRTPEDRGRADGGGSGG